MKLYRSFATVGGLTFVSRVMGFLRDIMFAALLGAGPVAFPAQLPGADSPGVDVIAVDVVGEDGRVIGWVR